MCVLLGSSHEGAGLNSELCLCRVDQATLILLLGQEFHSVAWKTRQFHYLKILSLILFRVFSNLSSNDFYPSLFFKKKKIFHFVCNCYLAKISIAISASHSSLCVWFGNSIVERGICLEFQWLIVLAPLFFANKLASSVVEVPKQKKSQWY